MFKRALTQFILCNMIIAVCWFSIKTLEVSRVAATPAFKQALLAALPEEQEDHLQREGFWGVMGRAASGQRIVEYNILERTSMDMPQEEYDILTRIVEAEAGNEDEKGRMLVAGVVLNRVSHKRFPNTVTDVVFQSENGTSQFSPVSNGRFYSVKVSEATIRAVDKVLAGEDVTEGALYFASRKHADPEKMQWFDNNLTKLFTYGGHEFFN